MVNKGSGKSPVDPDLDELLEKIKHGYPEAYSIIRGIIRLSNEAPGRIILDILRPNEEEQQKLRSRYPCLFLSRHDINRLRGIITKSREYKRFVRFKDVYTSDEEASLVEHVAGNIYDKLTDKEKGIYTPADIQHELQRIPVMNLGVIELPGNKMYYDFKEYVKQNISFFREHREIAARVLVRKFMERGERLYSDNLEGFLRDAEKDLREMGAYRK